MIIECIRVNIVSWNDVILLLLLFLFDFCSNIFERKMPGECVRVETERAQPRRGKSILESYLLSSVESTPPGRPNMAAAQEAEKNKEWSEIDGKDREKRDREKETRKW